MVTITISGPVMSGRSTIGEIIRRALHAHGVIIESSKPEFSPLDGEELIQRLLNNSHKLTVKIVEQQTKRESHE